MKSTYLVQPYHVGSRKAKSLALLIPAQIAKVENLSPSTVFALRVDDTKKIILEVVYATSEVQETTMKPADERFHVLTSRYHLAEINSPRWTT